MKFCKLLQSIQTDSPNMEGPLLDYKRMKKLLKLCRPGEAQEGDSEAEQPDVEDRGREAGTTEARDMAALRAPTAGPLQSPEEREFITSLNENLDRINDFFMEKEEESVIRLQVLEDRLNDAVSAEEMEDVRHAFVDFHGELVLLMHWCFLNYAAVAKILKKHDKVTGAVLKTAYLSNVLHQPFCSTDTISSLAKVVEDKVQQLGRADDLSASAQRREGAQALEVLLLRRTQAALGVWTELGQNASTPSTVASLAAAKEEVAAVDARLPKRQRTAV